MNIFADFFRERWEAQSEAELPIPPDLPYSFMAPGRVRTFQSHDYRPTPLRSEENLWPGITGELYVMVAYHATVVLALYEDGTVLWLDDHAIDADFEIFVRRERLLTWLPDRVGELIELLIATKLNFLGWPELIRQGSDIRPLPDYVKAQVSSKSEKGAQSIREADERLAEVASQIQPPVWVEDQAGNFQLQFYLWAHIFGVVVEVRCFFGKDQAFRYEAKQLAAEVGFYIVPR